MSEKHTPGRVFLAPSSTIGIGDPQKWDRLKMHSPWVEGAWEGDTEADANMRRLVACWNACDGVPTEVLEAQQSGGLPWLVADQIELRAERDRLAALCRDWEKKASTWTASPEAAQRLEGYRDLGRQVADAQNQRDELLAALQKIAGYDLADEAAMAEVARAAIAKVEGGAA